MNAPVLEAVLPGRAPAVPEIPVERFELACGATLLVSRRRAAPVCAVEAHLRGGHSLDRDGLEGTAFLAGRLVDQGTRARSEEELAAALEKSGGTLSGGATGISGTIVGERWKTLLEVLAECLVAPTYPAPKVERQKQRLLDRLLVEKDDPRVQGAWLFRKLVYGEHWLGRPDYGTLESVARIQRRHLIEHQRSQWCGARTLIAFCGDVEPQAVKRVLEKALAKFPVGLDLPPPSLVFPVRTRRIGVFPAARQQVHVYLGHLGIPRNHPDYAALVVMDHVLGTGPGFTSRISKRLRDEQGLAYSVHAAIHSSAGVLPGTFQAYIGTSPAHVSTAIAGFLEEMRRIQDELVSEAELALAKSYLTGSFVLGFERAARRVQHLVFSQRVGLPEGHLKDLVLRFAGVTAVDVLRVAQEHLRPGASVLAAAGPVKSSELESALRAGQRGSR